MVLLSSDGFLSQLPALFASTQQSGSVFVTVTRFVPRGEEERPPRVMYRAATSKRKLSAVLTQEEAPRFHASCIAVMKASMTALQKKVKPKKSKRAKDEAAPTATL